MNHGSWSCRQARCTTENATTLLGISNCTWTSCKVGCTKEVYFCWQIQVKFTFVQGTKPLAPPWAPISTFDRGDVAKDLPELGGGADMARLYPNVRGCGYPPELDCELFFKTYGKEKGTEFDCWVSTTDTSVAMTHLDLARAKKEVLASLVPLFIFILAVMYAFCRLGVFSICNPIKTCCPKANDARVTMTGMTPKRLYDYKKRMMAVKGEVSATAVAPAGQAQSLQPQEIVTPATPPLVPPPEEEDDLPQEGHQSLVKRSSRLESSRASLRSMLAIDESFQSSDPSSFKDSFQREMLELEVHDSKESDSESDQVSIQTVAVPPVSKGDKFEARWNRSKVKKES